MVRECMLDTKESHHLESKLNIDKDGRFQGKTIQINCEDEYFKKARELDNFFLFMLFMKMVGI